MTRRTVRFCAAALALATAGSLAAAAPPQAAVQGTVSKVVDGDSVWLVVDGRAPLEVRLKDIDAPEICQPHGAESKAALEALVLRQSVSLRPAGRDTYGRTLGVLMLADVDVNRRLVEDGHAWSTRSRWDEGPLVARERMAKALRRGLWAVGTAVMPRDFRSTHGPCDGTAVVATVPAPAQAPRTPAATTAAPPWQAPASARTSGRFTCDGRTRCTQMSSCAEATFFLQNCPGVTMDGNRDGVPCEQQFCRR